MNSSDATEVVGLHHAQTGISMRWTTGGEMELLKGIRGTAESLPEILNILKFNNLFKLVDTNRDYFSGSPAEEIIALRDEIERQLWWSLLLNTEFTESIADILDGVTPEMLSKTAEAVLKGKTKEESGG